MPAGRPRSRNPLTDRLTTRCTPEERADVQRAAEATGTGESEFIRTAVVTAAEKVLHSGTRED